MKASDERVAELQSEIRELQRALRFWLPGPPGRADPEISDRASADLALLYGYAGDTNEPRAERLGWITLRSDLRREGML